MKTSGPGLCWSRRRRRLYGERAVLALKLNVRNRTIWMSNGICIRDLVGIFGSIIADSNRRACVIKEVLELTVRLLMFSRVKR